MSWNLYMQGHNHGGAAANQWMLQDSADIASLEAQFAAASVSGDPVAVPVQLSDTGESVQFGVYPSELGAWTFYWVDEALADIFSIG